MLKPSHPAHIPSGLHYTFLQHEAWEVVPAAGGGSSRESFPSFGPKWSTVASKPLLPLSLSTPVCQCHSDGGCSEADTALLGQMQLLVEKDIQPCGREQREMKGRKHLCNVIAL